MYWASKNEAREIYELQQGYKDSLYLKMREYEYIKKNITNFLVCRIEQILVGNIEYIHTDESVVELGAFVIAPDLEKDQKHIICHLFLDHAKAYSQSINKILISLTNNPALQKIYIDGGLKKSRAKDGEFMMRKEKSEGVVLFYN